MRLAHCLFAIAVMVLAQVCAADVELSGNVPRTEIPRLQEHLDTIWKHETRKYSRAQTLLQPPHIEFYTFDRAQEDGEFRQWQKQWILANPSIWLDWTQISGLPAQALTKDWIDEHVDTIFPFPATFLAFHYDGTNRIQISPPQTFLRFYVNDPYGFKRETVGYGFYVASHEMLHYVFENNGVPGRLHHCLFVSKRDGHSLMGDMTEFLLESGIAAPLVRQVGLQSEEGMLPCEQLNAAERAEVQAYLEAIAF